MAVYWISFRIHDDSGYQDTYDELMATLASAVDNETWWIETTSFVIADSKLTIDRLASAIKMSIRVDRDLAIIGMPDFKSGRVVGHCADQDIFKLVPFMTKA